MLTHRREWLDFLPRRRTPDGCPEAFALLRSLSQVEWHAAAPPDDTGQPAHLASSAWPQWLEDEFWLLRRRDNVTSRRTSLVLAAALVAAFGLVDGYVAPQAKAELWFIRFGIFVPAILALLAVSLVQPLHRWFEAYVMLGVVVAGACLTAMTLIAPAHHAGLLLVVFASYSFLGLRCTHAISAGVVVSLLYAVAAAADANTPWAVVATNTCFLAACNIVGASVSHALEHGARREFRHVRALGEQRQLSERLLCNVLPVPVAQRLKLHWGTIAEAHPDVTILFADIVDFTSYAAEVAPERLVELLDEVFTRFDRLAHDHGLEKIKTIGDAYMVAGGIGAHGFDHVRAVADMALDMLDSARSLDTKDGRSVALRIGIHTGPVVAGVIGRTKFAYDLWGDTVNVASRLENLAMPGTIRVSEPTFERLRHDYVFSARQLVPVKGRGELPCYELLARNAAVAKSHARATSPRDFRAVRSAEIAPLALRSRFGHGVTAWT